jgi:hypothetical protein
MPPSLLPLPLLPQPTKNTTTNKNRVLLMDFYRTSLDRSIWHKHALRSRASSSARTSLREAGEA